MAPTPDDAADGLRDRLAREPGDTRRGIWIDQLAKVELDRARQANTIVAYKRFLAEFAVGDEAVVARALLEGLRFEQAQKVGTADAWEAFLADHPRGKHEVEARNALGTLEISAALKSQDLAQVRQTLARFPDHADRAQLVAHEDDLAWAVAANAGNEAIEVYLKAHPSGAHRQGAEQNQESNQLQELRDAEDLPRAQALAARADATPAHRALVAELQLKRALRMLDLDGLKKLSGTSTKESDALRIATQAQEALLSFESRPLTSEQRTTIAQALPGAGLPTRDALRSTVQSGDPFLRAAALRELAEWATGEDLPFFLSTLQTEYVGLRLEAVEAVRTLAQSLKPETWRSLRKTRENELLTKELTASIWRQIATLREADGRPAEAMTAWRAVLADDNTDLAARARLFALAQLAGDRISAGSTARDLAREAIQFADNRVAAPRPSQSEQPQGKGRVVGVGGNLTILRQICVAIDLGARASKALGDMGSTAPAQEQQLFTLAKTDADRALDRIRARRGELEKTMRGEDPSFPSCESDPAGELIQASRRTRVAAIRALAQGGDARLQPLVEGLTYAPGKDVRAAAADASSALRRAAIPR